MGVQELTRSPRENLLNRALLPLKTELRTRVRASVGREQRDMSIRPRSSVFRIELRCFRKCGPSASWDFRSRDFWVVFVFPQISLERLSNFRSANLDNIPYWRAGSRNSRDQLHSLLNFHNTAHFQLLSRMPNFYFFLKCKKSYFFCFKNRQKTDRKSDKKATKHRQTP